MEYSKKKKKLALYDINKSHRRHDKWKKPDTEEYILYDYIYMKLKNRQN